MINILYKIFIFIFIFVLSWTDVFSINGSIPIFIVIGFIVILLYMIIYKKINLSIYYIEDIFILLLLIWIIMSGLIQPNVKTINYVVVYIYILGFMYLLLKSIFYISVPIVKLLKINFYSVYFMLLFIILESVTYNIFNINLQEYLPRRRDTTAMVSDIFHRSYGFATEPGVISYYLSTLGLLSLWFIYYKSNYSIVKKSLFTIVFVLGELTLYSSTGFIAIILGFIFSFIVNLKYKKIVKFLLWSVLFIIILLILFPYISETLLPMYEKITNMSGNSSGSLRIERWLKAINIISENPILGIGIGGTGEGSPISWYLFIMSETGIISGIIILFFYFFTFFHIQRSKIKGKYLLLTSFIAGVIHLAVISTFQYPFLFIAIILISIIIKEDKKNHAKI